MGFLDHIGNAVEQERDAAIDLANRDKADLTQGITQSIGNSAIGFGEMFHGGEAEKEGLLDRAEDSLLDGYHELKDDASAGLHSLANFSESSFHKIEGLGSSAIEYAGDLTGEAENELGRAYHYVKDNAEAINPLNWWDNLKNELTKLLKEFGVVILVVGAIAWIYWEDISAAGKKTLKFAEDDVRNIAPYVAEGALLI